MKFQNISIHGSKVMLCTRDHNKQRNVTNKQTDKPEAICPPLFQNLGHKNKQTCDIY